MTVGFTPDRNINRHTHTHTHLHTYTHTHSHIHPHAHPHAGQLNARKLLQKFEEEVKKYDVESSYEKAAACKARALECEKRGDAEGWREHTRRHLEALASWYRCNRLASDVFSKQYDQASKIGYFKMLLEGARSEGPEP